MCPEGQEVTPIHTLTHKKQQKTQKKQPKTTQKKQKKTKFFFSKLTLVF